MSVQPGKIPVTIFDVRDLPSMNPQRAGKTDTMIMYDVDPMHRYFITVPKEEISDTKGGYDEGKIATRIHDDLEARSKILGKQIVV
jgi:hypothetical protein